MHVLIIAQLMFRAGADGTAGTVLAIPLFDRLRISRCGLAIQSGGVAPMWWRSFNVNVVHRVVPRPPRPAFVACIRKPGEGLDGLIT